MLPTNYTYFLIFIAAAMTLSCVPPSEKWEENGLAPIYVSPTDFTQIRTELPRVSDDQGSQEEKNGYIYINERFEGIHVFDNTNPANPIKVYFWRIPGNTEFEINGDRLYADNSRHLLTIDISDRADIEVLSYVEDVYSINMENNNFPTMYEGRFECAEFDKGIVVGWESKLLDSPRCYIF